MTEFEKWWETHPADLVLDPKGMAERMWNAAQRAVLRTLSDPPYIPKVGEKVRILSLCHPNSLGKVKKVVHVELGTLENVHWMQTEFIDEDGEPYYSSGLLGEVEPVKEEKE
jgi:hypothetical protein